MEQHPLVFPTGLRLVLSMESIFKQGWKLADTITEEEKAVGYVHNMHFRTPVDDEHTMHYNMSFVVSKNRMPVDAEPPFETIHFKDDQGNYRLQHVTAQDVLAWESQGPVMDRTREHIGADDRGVILAAESAARPDRRGGGRRRSVRNDPRPGEKRDRLRPRARAVRAVSCGAGRYLRTGISSNGVMPFLRISESHSSWIRGS